MLHETEHARNTDISDKKKQHKIKHLGVVSIDQATKINTSIQSYLLLEDGPLAIEMRIDVKQYAIVYWSIRK